MRWERIVARMQEEWIHRGRAWGLGEALLDILGARFGRVPSDMAVVIGSLTDLPQLRDFVVLAAKAPSLEQFRHDAQL
jgi:hypothetical protein